MVVSYNLHGHQLTSKCIIMDNLFRKFYRTLFLNTGGFLPTKPLNQSIYPGDFFKIRNGQMIVLGNVFQYSLLDLKGVNFDYSQRLNSSKWQFDEGISIPYSGSDEGSNPIEGGFTFTKQILSFKQAGSHIFRSNDVEATSIANWHDLSDELIIKLTQNDFSFREVFVVTDAVTMSDWTLAIAGKENAELEIATDSNQGIVGNIFGLPNTKTNQSKYMEYYHQETKRIPSFFKASKLVIKDDVQDDMMRNIISSNESQKDWADNFFDVDMHYTRTSGNLGECRTPGTICLDMLKVNQLNPSTSLNYFAWRGLNMDDIEELFV